MYRGTSISKKEFDIIKEGLEKKKSNPEKFSIVSLYAKCFLSFSKYEEKIIPFLNRTNSNEELYKAEFIIEPIEGINYDFLISNVDMEEFSTLGEIESEVLILPFCCLEVVDLEDKGDMKIIHFQYLNKCYKEILKYICTPDKNKLYDFYKKVIKSEYAQEIKKCNYYISNRLDNETYKYIYYKIPKIVKDFPILCNEHYKQKGEPKFYVFTNDELLPLKEYDSKFAFELKNLLSKIIDLVLVNIKNEFEKEKINNYIEEKMKIIKNYKWQLKFEIKESNCFGFKCSNGSKPPFTYEDFKKKIKKFIDKYKDEYYYPLDLKESEYYMHLYHQNVVEELKFERRHPEKRDKLDKLNEHEKKFYKTNYKFDKFERDKSPNNFQINFSNNFYIKKKEEEEITKENLEEIKKEFQSKQEQYLKESERYGNFEKMKKYLLETKSDELKGKDFDEWVKNKHLDFYLSIKNILIKIIEDSFEKIFYEEKLDICRICFKEIKEEFDGCRSFEDIFKTCEKSIKYFQEKYQKSPKDTLLWKYVGFI